MNITQIARAFGIRGRERAIVTTARWVFRHFWRPVPHGLNSELIVSLTSYAARFGTLGLTLRCLLTQSVKPDRVILWLTPEDIAILPNHIKALTGQGLDIRETSNLRSYKKVIPALLAFPDATIVTADDDLFYERHWLMALIRAWDGSKNQIVCRRAHRFLVKDGAVAPYEQWPHNITGNDDPTTIFPTGGAGALYPSGSLDSEVLDENAFMALAPFADDLWLYWMGRRAGSSYKIVEKPWKLVVWPSSQKNSLYAENVRGGNDSQIANLVDAYGLPCPTGEGRLTRSAEFA